MVVNFRGDERADFLNFVAENQGSLKSDYRNTTSMEPPRRRSPARNIGVREIESYCQGCQLPVTSSG